MAIRPVPDGDTAWGSDIRAVIAWVNNTITLTPSGGDDASQISTALTSGNVILRGNFAISSQVTVPSNRTICGEGYAQITWIGSDIAAAFFVVGANTDVLIENIRFVGISTGQVAVIVAGGDDITVRHNEMTNCRVFESHAAANAAYSAVTTAAQRCQRIAVNYNRGVGANRIGNEGAIRFEYCDQWQAIGNDISTYSNGIIWWGGNSNFGIDGALANERKCTRGLIAYNTTRAHELGGIWGSMGQDIVIDGNYVEDCSDVGIDPEGCTRVTCANNIVKDCVNGNYAVFFGSKSITFDGGESVQSNPAWPHFRTYNSSTDPALAPGPILFRGVTVNTTTGTGIIDNANGPVGSVTIEDCDLTDTFIDWGFNGNNRRINILGNRFIFTRAKAAAFAAINLGGDANFGGVKVIQDNVIETEVAQTATAVGGYVNGAQSIYTSDSDTNTSPRLIVTGNIQKGTWPGNIRCLWRGTNAAFRLYAFVTNNVANVINVNSTGAGVAATVASASNFNDTAGAVTVGTA